MGTHKSTQLSTVPPFRPIPSGPAVIAVQSQNDTVRRYAVATVPQFHALPSSIMGTVTSRTPQVFKDALQQATDSMKVYKF